MTTISRAMDWLSTKVWLLLVPLAIPAFTPFLTEGLPRSFDGGTHLLRIGRLDEHLRSGALFPRWIPELLLGNGYPVFNYYAPSTYYLVELFHLVGLDLYYAFILSFCVLVLVGAVGRLFLGVGYLQSARGWTMGCAACCRRLSLLALPDDQCLHSRRHRRGRSAGVVALDLLERAATLLRSPSGALCPAGCIEPGRIGPHPQHHAALCAAGPDRLHDHPLAAQRARSAAPLVGIDKSAACHGRQRLLLAAADSGTRFPIGTRLPDCQECLASDEYVDVGECL